MEDDRQEYEDFYYNDGEFEDGYDDDYYEDDDDDYGIPTYDELDVWGRYYVYGSRYDYMQWRAQEIESLRAQEREEILRTKYLEERIPNIYSISKDTLLKRHNKIELCAPRIPLYDQITRNRKALFDSREGYNNWRNNLIQSKRKARKKRMSKRNRISDILISGFCYLSLILLVILYFVLK